jgi:hypothetical protein
MTLPEFSPYSVQSDKMFYILDYIEGDSISLFRQTPAGPEDFTEFTAHRLANGQVLLAFPEHFRLATKGNLIATDGNREEVVNLTLYERLRPHYDRGISFPNGEKGLFFFANSQPIHDPRDEWRCDTTAYGPQKYLAPGEEPRQLLSALDQIKTFEPVLSVNGVAHIFYIQKQDGVEARQQTLNGDIVPTGAVTLSEMLKLIHEWALVTEPPFSSQEEIALDARDFLEALAFYPGLVSDQTEMQVARYLRRHPDARRRPDDPVDNTDELRLFLKRRVAHGSLAGALSLYPGSGDVALAAEIDISNVDSDYASTLFYFQVDPQGHSIDRAEEGIAAIDGERLGGAQAFMRVKVATLLQKLEIARLLRDNPSATI